MLYGIGFRSWGTANSSSFVFFITALTSTLKAKEYLLKSPIVLARLSVQTAPSDPYDDLISSSNDQNCSNNRFSKISLT